MLRYPGGLDVVVERFLPEEHTTIEYVSLGVVRGVHHVDHVKPAKVQRYPKYKRHISQGHFHIHIAVPYHVSAADKHHLIFSAITNDQVLVVGAREVLIVK